MRWAATAACRTEMVKGFADAVSAQKWSYEYYITGLRSRIAFAFVFRFAYIRNRGVSYCVHSVISCFYIRHFLWGGLHTKVETPAHLRNVCQQLPSGRCHAAHNQILLFFLAWV